VVRLNLTRDIISEVLACGNSVKEAEVLRWMVGSLWLIVVNWFVNHFDPARP
jgi:hypothetical protein